MRARSRFRAACASLTTVMGLALTSCGAPGVPQPPSLHLPAPVTDLRAFRKGERVQLAWTAPERTTDQQILRQLGVTDVCRSDVAPIVECGTPVGEVQAPTMPAAKGAKQQGPKIAQGFVDTLPAGLFKNDASAQLVYAVAPLNTSGRGAGLSNQVSVSAAPTLPPPGDLRPKMSAEGVGLSATSSATPIAISGLRYFYRIYRREKGSDASTVAGEVPWNGSFAYTDTTFTWEKSYLYRVTVVTEIMKAQPPETLVEGDDSPETEIFAHDVFPPAVPSGLQAVFSNESQPSVDLIWSPDADADLDGYNVYRGENGGALARINSVLLKAPAFRDPAVTPGTTYAYSVSAVDVRGNESARSEAARESIP